MRHPVDDPDIHIVHVTAPTHVVEHGVTLHDGVRYSGELDRGIAVVNGLGRGGRRLGADVLARVREKLPIDLVGIGSEQVGGPGEIPHAELPAFMSRYRFFFNPIRY